MRKIRDNYSCVQALAAVFCFTVLITQCDLIWGQEKTAAAPDTAQTTAKPDEKKSDEKQENRNHKEQKKELPPLAVMLAQAMEHNPDIGVAESQVREAEAQLNRTRLTVVQQVMELRQAWESQRELLKHAQQLIGTRQEAHARVQKLFERGAASSAEEASVRGLLSQTEIEYITQQAKIAEIKAKLSYLLGTQPAKFPQNAESSSDDLDKLKVQDVIREKIPANKTPEHLGKIRAALDEATIVDFTNSELIDVTEYLKDFHNIKIFVDKKAFEIQKDGKSAFEYPVISIQIEGVSLGAVLQALEDANPGLSFVVRDYGILITKQGKEPKGATPLREFWKAEKAAFEYGGGGGGGGFF